MQPRPTETNTVNLCQYLLYVTFMLQNGKFTYFLSIHFWQIVEFCCDFINDIAVAVISIFKYEI